MRRRAVIAVAAVLSLSAPAAAQNTPPPAAGLTLLDAVKTALEKHPVLQLQQREIDISRARRQQASGAFDTTITAGVGQATTSMPLTALQQQIVRQSGLTFTDNRTTTTQYGGGLSRQLRNGITFEPNGSVTRVSDRLDYTNALAQTSISFDVVVPLMRGRGRDVVTAQETAADFDVGATVLDYNQAVAERILEVVSAYWRAVTARRLLALSVEAEDRGRVLVEETQRLVDADRVPRAEMNQLWANLASRSADRIDAEQDLVEARQALGLAMGLRAAEGAALPVLADDLPDASPARAAAALDADALAQQALAHRADYLAALKRIRESDALVPAARNGLRPQFDLRVGGGYSAQQEGLQLQRIFSNLFYQASGPNASVTFQYSIAPSRNEARGRLAEAEASVLGASLRRDDLARSIAAGVVTALAGVRSAAAALDKAGEAVGYYRSALDGEREKQKLGRSSLIDVLTVEDRLTNVLQVDLRARLRCAVSIAQLRFSSGTFIDPEAQVPALTRESLTTVPLR